MVINKFGDRLYAGLVETLSVHLRGIAERVEAVQGESFLRELKMRWDHHNKSMQMIRDILMVRSKFCDKHPVAASYLVCYVGNSLGIWVVYCFALFRK